MLKLAIMLLPIFALIGLIFWFLLPTKTSPVIISDQKITDTSQIVGLSDKLNNLENKVVSLESSNSALLSKLSDLESKKTSHKTSTVTNNSKKSSVLIPINPGGEVNSKEWTNLTSGSITLDTADYPGYKNAYLIINLSVYVGQGQAFAQLVNPKTSLAILPSEVSTSSDKPISLTSGPFKLFNGSNTYTVQLKTLTEGYPAQAANSFLQITY